VLETLSGWELDVDRGPGWLFVKIRCPKQDQWEPPALADRLWGLLQEHLVERLVLQLDEIEILSSRFIGQLILLYKRISSRGGVLRLSGLSPENREVLRLCRLDERFACYRSREEAVLGSSQPVRFGS
jgi:anti-anti-sigma factor